MRRPNSTRWTSTSTNKTLPDSKSASSSLNTKVSSTYQLHSTRTQSRNLRAVITMSEFLSPPRISAIYCRFQLLTKCNKRSMVSKRNLHLQQTTPAKRWPTTIKSSCLLSHLVLQKLNANLPQYWQTELMIKQALKKIAKALETSACTRWQTRCPKFQQK